MDNGIVGDGTLMDEIIKNGVCSSESLNGSCDVWSCKDSDSSSADHLVIMVHGIFGSASDWKFAAEQFVKMLPDKVIVHCSERNMSMLTLDGVDVMGERLALEVLEVIQRNPNLRKISFVAHSVGGLVARYAIGILYRPPQRENVEDSVAETGNKDVKATIGGLEAINFITVATPHLGSRGNKQITMLILLHSLEFYFTPALSCDEFKLICNWKNEKTKPYYAPPYGSGACINVVPFLFGLTAIEKTAVRVIHWILKRTGQHLFLADDDEGKPPLLKRMIQDYCNCFFMSALRIFKRRVVYSNVGYDRIVGWRTSSIRRDNELPDWENHVNEKYPHIVYEERCKADNAEQCDLIISTEDNSSDKLEEELVTGLSRVSWEKVDVSFHTSRRRFAAHSVIQVKDHVMHIEGADVIQHMIDNFLL